MTSAYHIIASNKTDEVVVATEPEYNRLISYRHRKIQDKGATEPEYNLLISYRQENTG